MKCLPPATCLCFTTATLVLLFAQQTLAANNSASDVEGQLENCTLYTGEPITTAHLLPQCCNSTFERQRYLWRAAGRNLVDYLARLRAAQCTQFFRQECQQRTYQFTEYTARVYDLFCNRTLFEARCREVVANNAAGLQSNATWSQLLRGLREADLTAKQLSKPCIQVALYDAVSKARGSEFGYFVEVKRLFLPFCDFVWCGVDAQNSNEIALSSWTCMPQSCRTSIILCTVFCGILGFLIMATNATVIVVFANSKKLRNSQGVYKISLSMSDFLIGAVVLPTFASSLFNLANRRAEMGDPYLGSRFTAAANDTEGSGEANAFGSSINESRFDAVPRSPSSTPPMDSSYLGFVGFFTTLSLLISIYTLTVASFDRLAVVRKPLKYSRSAARKLAVKACAAIWALSIVFACIPFFGAGLSYNLVASVLVSMTGSAALYIYAIALALPLLVMWLVSLATMAVTRYHGKQRKSLQQARQRSQQGKRVSTELRLAKTLLMMVGVFTLSLLPTIAALVAPFFMPNLVYSRPELLEESVSSAFTAFEFVAVVVLVANSLWNIFIYNSRNPDFRAATLDTFGACCRSCGSKFRRILRRGRSRLASATNTSSAPVSSKKTTTTSGDTQRSSGV